MKQKDNSVTSKKYMSTGEVLSYGFGLFGFQMIIGFMTTYQAEFFNMAMGANFALVGILILIAKVASAVFDPFIGNLIDRTNNKRGKLKPFIFYSLLPFFVLTVLIFSPFEGMSGAGMYVYIFITYFLWCISMTLGDIPSQAMASVITPDGNERNSVVSLSNTLKSVGQAAPNVLLPLVSLLVPLGAAGFSGTYSKWEYFWGAVIIGVMGVVMFSLIAFKNKERVPYHTERMGFRDMLGVLKGNKYLLLVFISYFLGFGRIAATAILAQTAGAILGSQTQVLFLGLTTALGSMISMLICPALVKKFDVKKTFIGMSIYTFVTSAIAIIVSFSIGYEGAGLYIMFALMFIRGLGFGSYYILPMLMVADSVDYYEYKTGKRTEGVSYAVLSFAIKVTMAMGAAVALALITASGYNSTAPELSTKLTKDWVYFAFTGFPGICYLLSAIPIFFYDLTGKKKEKIHAELLARRAAAQSAEDGNVAEIEGDFTADTAADNAEAFAEDAPVTENEICAESLSESETAAPAEAPAEKEKPADED